VPSVSKKQHNFMEAVAHNAAFAKKAGVPQSVGKDFSSADKGRKFKQGGTAMKDADLAQDKKMIKRAIAMHDKQEHPGKKTNLSALKKGGVAKTVTKEMEYDYKSGKKSFAGTTAQRDAHAEKEGKKVAKDLAFDKRKAAMGFKAGGVIASKMGKVTAGGKRPHGEHTVQTKGLTKGKNIKMRG
jgi:hypothetical protein